MPTGRGRGNAPLCGAGCAAPPLGGPKEKNGGRARPCGGDLEACAIPLGNRESASPHLGAWERLSGVADVWPLILFPRSALLASLSATGRSMERQWKEKQTKSVLHPDARKQLVAGCASATFSKTVPAPNAEVSLDCPMSLVGTPRTCSNPPKAGFGHKALFSSTGRGAFSFPAGKENGGRHPRAGNCPNLKKD